jgi:hypothetical protein
VAGVSAKSAVLQGRAAAEAIMLDACTIARQTGQPGPVDPVTGIRPPAPTATVYAGKCRVQSFEAYESTPDSGDHVYTVQRYSVHLPVTVNVAVDDQITMTSAQSDSNLVGRSYRVVALLHKTFATANRVAVSEIL